MFRVGEPSAERAERVDDGTQTDGVVRAARVQHGPRAHAVVRCRGSNATYVSVPARAKHRALKLARRDEQRRNAIRGVDFVDFVFVVFAVVASRLARAQQDVELVLARVTEHARGDVAARRALQRGPRRVHERAQRRAGYVRHGRARAFVFERVRERVVRRKRRVSDRVRAGVQARQRLVPRARRGGPREVVPQRRVHHHVVALGQRDEHRQHCRGVTRQHDPCVVVSEER